MQKLFPKDNIPWSEEKTAERIKETIDAIKVYQRKYEKNKGRIVGLQNENKDIVKQISKRDKYINLLKNQIKGNF